LGERPVKRGSAMSAGAETHQLVDIACVGFAFAIGAFESRDIDQQLYRRRLSCQGTQRHDNTSAHIVMWAEVSDGVTATRGDDSLVFAGKLLTGDTAISG